MSTSSKEFEQRFEVLEPHSENWYVNNPTFRVVNSLHSIGQDRGVFGQQAARHIMAGNMSPFYGPKKATTEEKAQLANEHMIRFFESLNYSQSPSDISINPAEAVVVFPDRDYDTPLNILNADEQQLHPETGMPTYMDTRSDMIYSRNPDLAMMIRPADCSIAAFTAKTPEGPIHGMIHFAWQGIANGYIDQATQHLQDLGVDFDSLRIYLTPGGHAESYIYHSYQYPQNPWEQYPEHKALFLHVEGPEVSPITGKPGYNFELDPTYYAYSRLLPYLGDENHIFVDTTDTTSDKAGTSSQSRMFNGLQNENDPTVYTEDNARDIVILIPEGQLHPYQPKDNPDKPAPIEILQQIVALPVDYIDFEGNEQHSVIEVNKAVAKDVEAFFVRALEIGFPIEKIVKSSDPDYGWDDGKLLKDNASSGFNYRLIKWNNKPSKHGLGLAFDINTRVNPYITYGPDGPEVDPPSAVYDSAAKGALYDGHPLVAFMKERGWEWGGDWKEEVDPETGKPTGRTDYQHFGKILPED